MLQKTSTSNKTPRYFAYCLKKNIPFFIMVAIYFLLTLGAQGLQIGVEVWPYSYYTDYFYAAIYYLDTYIISGFALVAAIVSFRFLSSKKISDVYYSLPIRKTVMFWSNYFSGLLAIIVPFVLLRSPILTIILKDGNMGEAMYESYIYKINNLWQNFAVQAISLLFAYAIAVFFVVNFGKILDLCIYYFSLKILLPIVNRFVFSILESGVAGFESSENVWLYIFNNSVLLYSDKKEKMLYFLIYLIAIVAFTVAAFLLFRIRKSERSEKTFAFNSFKPVIAVVSALVFGFYIYIFILGQKSDVKSLIAFAPAFFVGAAIAYFGTLILSKRSFKIFNKNLFFFAIPCIVFAVLLAFISTGAFGKAAYIPEISEIESVSITKYTEENYYQNNNSNGNKDFIGKNIVFSPESYTDNQIVFTEADAVETVAKYHKSILKEFEKYDYNIKALTSSTEYSYDSYNPTITYKLKNGKTVTRKYTNLSKNWRNDEFYKMTSLEEPKIQNVVALERYLSELNIGDFNCVYFDAFPLSEFVCEKKNIKLQEDDFIKLLTTVYEDEQAFFYNEAYNTAKDYMEIRIVGGKLNKLPDNLIKNNCLVIKDNYTKTIELLEKLGLKRSKTDYEGLNFNYIKAELIRTEQAIEYNICTTDNSYDYMIESNSKETVDNIDFKGASSYTLVEYAPNVESILKSAVSCHQNWECRAVRFIMNDNSKSKIYFVPNEVLNELDVWLNY